MWYWNEKDGALRIKSNIQIVSQLDGGKGSSITTHAVLILVHIPPKSMKLLFYT